MKCICGYEFTFEWDIDILREKNRCPNCDRNTYDIDNAKYIKKLESLIKEFINLCESEPGKIIECYTDDFYFKCKEVIG